MQTAGGVDDDGLGGRPMPGLHVDLMPERGQGRREIPPPLGRHAEGVREPRGGGPPPPGFLSPHQSPPPKGGGGTQTTRDPQSIQTSSDVIKQPWTHQQTTPDTYKPPPHEHYHHHLTTTTTTGLPLCSHRGLCATSHVVSSPKRGGVWRGTHSGVGPRARITRVPNPPVFGVW